MEGKRVPIKPNPQLDPNFYQSKSPEKFAEGAADSSSRPPSYKIQIGNRI